MATKMADAADSKWAMQLATVAAELDPRLPIHPSFFENSSYYPTTHDNFSMPWDFSARLPGMAPPKDTINKSVCPEVYFGKTLDEPFRQHGMEAPKRCKEAPLFSKVLTILLPAKHWSEKWLWFVIKHIQEQYDVPIFALKDKEMIIINPGNSRISKNLKFSGTDSLNEAVNLIETPFVLVGESLVHFSNQSSMERLVRVLDDLQHVQVAGGAARDTQGHWIHGCLQQHMANYQAKYTMGYYYSKYECMYCDDLLTPFVTRTKLLKSLPFNAALSGQAMYRDWFAKVRDTGHLTVVCPDVMFFLMRHVTMTSEDWLPMAKQWLLEVVLSFDGQIHHFSCESLQIICDDLMSIVDSYLTPPCCVRFIVMAINKAFDEAEIKNLEYELHAGSVLGAVKFGSWMPWDIDMDILIECKDYVKWMDIAYTYLHYETCKLLVMERDVYFAVRCPRYLIEFVCKPRLSRFYLPGVHKNFATRIKVNGRWTKVLSNPGLYSRNCYGFEILQHAQHWRHLPPPESGISKGGYEFPGKWRNCRTPNHHFCLDRYPGDGNLPFLDPFLHP